MHPRAARTELSRLGEGWRYDMAHAMGTDHTHESVDCVLHYCAASQGRNLDSDEHPSFHTMIAGAGAPSVAITDRVYQHDHVSTGLPVTRLEIP